ncbi:hypothetical protein DFP72DRAFT_860399 [Ephemerocybe angulata]|uniref:Uncharacterized protein n=1 Tax=Ephemerocybe angulata TaxID=980116 RepID=A0A8H6LVR3_9AGAR|nr:hypothetical protein DFP72DRAFT_860399 [Tulosesus angulatus]
MANETGPTPHVIDTSSSYALRNPLREIIPPRLNGQAKQTPLEKAATQEHREKDREKKALFHEELQALRDTIKEEVKAIADRHSQKPEHVESLALSLSRFKKTRGLNIQNALVHAKKKEVNDSLPKGQRYKLSELQKMVEEDGTYDDMTEEDFERLLSDLAESKKLKRKGARASNRAQTLDANAIMVRVNEELNNLSERTGCAAFAFLTGEHALDTMVPGWVNTPGVLRFFVEVLNLSAAELSKKFEMWQKTQKRLGTLSSTAELQANISRILLDGLNRILNRTSKRVKMNYINYDVAIRQRYKVQIIGWPAGMRLVCPAQITANDELQVLNSAVTDGECRWAKMTPADVVELEKKLESAPVRKRKVRSDVGKPRKKRGVVEDEGSDEEEDEERPAKKAKATLKSKRGSKASRAAKMMPPAVKSRAIIESSSEEEEESSGGGDEEDSNDE